MNDSRTPTGISSKNSSKIYSGMYLMIQFENSPKILPINFL